MTVPHPPATVSDRDRAIFARQAAALATEENDDEGTPEYRAAVIQKANAWRVAHGIEELDTEPELHRRARDLGLLRRVP